MRQVIVFAVILIQAVASRPPSFEVASVKPNTESGIGVRGDCHGAPPSVFGTVGPDVPVGRCVIAAARLSHLIPIAYGVPLNRVKGGPDFVWGVPRFNIDAKAENPSATYAELTQMLQSLLADRFKLRIHREARPTPGYVMTIAPGGSKLKVSTAKEPSLVFHGASINKLDAIDGKNKELNTITGKRISIAQLAELFSRLPPGDPIVDNTGLTGLYDISLQWEPDEELSRVLQAQLGLRLERQQVPVDFLFIDSAEMPTEN